MTDGRSIRLATAVAAAVLAGTAALAQVRPLARPADLDAPTAEEAVAAPMAEEAVVHVSAEATPMPAAPASPEVGPETNLPLPRFVSLKTDEGNARRGPSLDQRIDWVFVREDMPLQITAEYENWRRVEDRDGVGGWVHYSLLSGTRTVIVDADPLPLRVRPEETATQVALLERNVIARLESCEVAWCRITAGGYGGWAPKTSLWGVGAEEILD